MTAVENGCEDTGVQCHYHFCADNEQTRASVSLFVKISMTERTDERKLPLEQQSQRYDSKTSQFSSNLN